MYALVWGKISYIILWHGIKPLLSFTISSLCFRTNVLCKSRSRQPKDTNPFSALYSPTSLSSAFWFPSSLLNKDILRTVQYCCLPDTAQNWEPSVCLCHSLLLLLKSDQKADITTPTHILEMHTIYGKINHISYYTINTAEHTERDVLKYRNTHWSKCADLMKRNWTDKGNIFVNCFFSELNLTVSTHLKWAFCIGTALFTSPDIFYSYCSESSCVMCLH